MMRRKKQFHKLVRIWKISEFKKAARRKDNFSKVKKVKPSKLWKSAKLKFLLKRAVLRNTCRKSKASPA